MDRIFISLGLSLIFLVGSALASGKVQFHGARPSRGLLAKDNDGGDPDPICCGMLQSINFTSNLPVVIIDTYRQLVNRTKIPASLCSCSTGMKGGDYRGPVKMKERGGINTQRYNRLRQYAVYLNQSDPFLGMPGGTHFILHAQQNDTFDLKFWMGLELARATGQWTPLTQHTEVGALLDGPNFLTKDVVTMCGNVPNVLKVLRDDGAPLEYPRHYRGIYMGVEHIERDKNRLNLTKNTDPANPSGGFIMEFRHGERDPDASWIIGNVYAQSFQDIRTGTY
eukprot:jgi/Botrbrau1/7402/Bobra.0112s0003.1